jgi:hypothetical protein
MLNTTLKIWATHDEVIELIELIEYIRRREHRRPAASQDSLPFIMRIEVEPGHPPAAKGDRGGACYRGACSNQNAEWYNVSTRRWYCDRCARVINTYAGADICQRPDPTKRSDQHAQ